MPSDSVFVLLLRHVRQLIHVLDEQQMGAAQVHIVVRGQLPLAFEADVVDARAVEAVEIADAPAAARCS